MARNVGTTRTFSNYAKKYIDAKVKATNPFLVNSSGKDKYRKYEKYQQDPCKFARDVLKVKLWSKQEDILNSLTVPPYRTLCAASHAVGKSYVSAISVLWMFFCFPYSITVTTAPTNRQVSTVLWGLLRELNTIDKSVFIGTTATRMEINKRWYALGFTPSSGDALNGIHSDSGDMLIVYDEATGIDPEIWEATRGLDNDQTRWLCIFNPTSTSSQVFNEWNSPEWKKIRISSTEHPNILAELKGESPPYPGAIRLKHFDELLRKWSTPTQGKPNAEDLEWPPNSGTFITPGNLARSRCLGLFPTTSIDSVWNYIAIERALKQQQISDEETTIIASLDVARGGEDYSVFGIRRGNSVIDLQRRNGLLTNELFGEMKIFLDNWGIELGVNSKGIETRIDVTGLGGGVTDLLIADRYNIIPVDFGSRAIEDDKYANKRAELHFNVAEKALDGLVDLSRIDEEIISYIKRQATGVLFEYDVKGRRILESKKASKRRLKMSPDELDAIALLYYDEISTITISS